MKAQSTCPYQCSTCVGNAQGISCTTCTVGSHRTFTALSCPCDSGYYDDGVDTTCVQCLHSCYSCDHASYCLTCGSDTTYHRTFHSGQCPCDPGYYDDEMNEPCLSCKYQCLTCKIATTCATCLSTSYRTLTSSQCPCNAGYYDDGSNQLCVACNVACATCTSGTSCSSCATGYYYDSSQPLCLICEYQCTTCNNGNTCASCSINAHRTLTLAQCPCDDGYYDDGSHMQCVKCGYTCTTCSSATVCVTCSSASHRTITTQKCPCDAGYYDDGMDFVCVACQYQCATCTNGTSCLTCPNASQRTLTTPSPSLCPCNAGYYDNGVPTCVVCSYKCLTCTSATQCTSCVTSSQRTLDSSSATCPCNTLYYDDGSNTACAVCQVLCATCSNANSCDTCKPGYYKDSSNPFCLQCSYTCQTCSSGTTCDTCLSSSLRTYDSIQVKCPCNSGYYDDGSSKMCATCGHSCVTCTSATICVTCPPNTTTHRSFHSSQCSCDQGYFDDEISAPCGICNYTCMTCTNQNACSSCSMQYQRTQIQSSCICNQGYYDDGKNQACASCNYTCATCTTGAVCDSCSSTNHRTISQQQCPCNAGYYDDGSSAACQQCGQSCATCVNGQTCTKQRSTYLDSATNTYLLCNYSCATCVDGSSCLSCPNNSYRTFHASQCPCNAGYYDDGMDPTCLVCDKSCATCLDGTSCVTCASGFVKTTSSSKLCFCQQSYSNNGVQACCDTSCLTCNGSTKNSCLSCDTSIQTMRVILGSSCPCRDGYYQDYTNQCTMCHYTCKTCNQSTSCTSCDSNSYRVFQTNQCNCATNYFDDKSNALCLNCDPTCQDCFASSQFDCTSCSSINNRQLNQNQCICKSATYSIPGQVKCSGMKFYNKLIDTCPYGYFYDSFNSICLQCCPGCDVCTGGQASDCTQCSAIQPFACELESTPSINQYINDQVQVQGAVVKYTCSSGQPSRTYLQGSFDYSWSMTSQDGSIALQKNGKYIYPSAFIIPAQLASAGISYTIQFSATQQGTTESATTLLNYTNQGPFVQIEGGNRTVSTQNSFSIVAHVYDFDQSQLPLVDVSNYKIQWSCIDQQLNMSCNDISGQTIQLDQTKLTQTFKKLQFQALERYDFQVKIADLSNRQSSDKVSIIVITDNLPQFSLGYDPTLMGRKVNINEDIIITFLIKGNPNPDDLFFSGSFMYAQKIVKKANFNYLKVQFKIENFFSDFTQKIGSQFIFQGSVFDPKYTDAATASVKFNINIPPESCTIDISPQSGQDISEIFTYSIYNCRDENFPLTYSFSYYMNNTDLELDIMEAQKYRLIPLRDFDSDSTFSSFLSLNTVDSKQQEIIIVAQIQDSLGGISNITQYLRLKRTEVVKTQSIIKIVNNTKVENDQMLKILLYSQKLQQITNDSSITALKFQLLDILKKKDFMNSSQFQQNQLIMAQSNLQYGGDVRFPSEDIFTNLNNLNFTLNLILSSQQSVIKQYLQHGMSTQLQSRKNGNLLLANKYSKILSVIMSQTQANFYDKINQTNPQSESSTIDEQCNEYTLQILAKLSHILLTGTELNQPMPSIKTNNFEIVALYVTSLGLDQATGSHYTSKLSNQGDTTKTAKSLTQSVNKNTSYYSFSSTKFKNNPKQTDSRFPYKYQATVLIDYKIKRQTKSVYNSTQDILEGNIFIQQPMLFEFKPTDSQISSQVCISTDNDDWNNLNCETLHKATQIQCTCNKLSYYSVVDDVDGIYSDQLKLFSPIYFDWLKVALVYIVSSISLIAFGLLIWGYRKDKLDDSQVHPVLSEEQLQEQQFQEAKEFHKQALKINSPQQKRKISRKIEHEMATSYTQSMQRIVLQMNQSFGQRRSQKVIHYNAGSDQVIQDTPQPSNSKFAIYLLMNHPYTNIIYEHERDFSRPIRICLVYSIMLQFLTITVYYTDSIQLIKTIALTIATSVVGTLTSVLYTRTLVSNSKFIKSIGIILFSAINLFAIYITTSVVTPTSSYFLTNQWAAQFSIALVWDIFFFQAILIIIKYKLEHELSDESSGRFSQCLRMMFIRHKIILFDPILNQT